ncbi:MAG: hypothetical protein AAB562_01445 [Patescibacteria group bacterium]
MARIVVLGESREFKKLFGKALTGEGHTLAYKSSVEEARNADPHIVIIVNDQKAQKRCQALQKAKRNFKTILWAPDWSPDNKIPKGAAHLLIGGRSVSGMLGAVRGTLILIGRIEAI